MTQSSRPPSLGQGAGTYFRVFFLFFGVFYGKLALLEELELVAFHVRPEPLVLDQDLSLQKPR